MRFDDIFKQLGEFGSYQKRIFILLCIPIIFSGFHVFTLVLELEAPAHRCKIPGYQNDTYDVQNARHAELIAANIPPSGDDTLLYSKCNLYDLNKHADSNTTIACKEWVYDKSVFISTFTSENNLVCKDSLKTSHAQMIFFGGILAGSLGFGALSDAIGRKKTICLSFVCVFGFTLSVAWAPNFTVFAVLRFLIGASWAGMFMTSFVIGMEFVGPSKRIWTGDVNNYFFAAGLVIFAGVGYSLRQWRQLKIICAAPLLVFLSYWWLIPESPRWLVSKGRYAEANSIILHAAKVNKVEVSENQFTEKSFEKVKEGKIWELFTSRVLLIRSFIIFFNWVVVTMVYYGLSFNTGNLGGDFYLNLLISGLVEFPAYTLCLLLLDRIGRRVLHAGCMIIGGLACVSTIFTKLFADDSLQPITVTLAMIGKLGISAAFAVIYIWSAELYPTVVRNSGMGASSSCARIGGMIAPYIADLSKVIEGNLGQAIPLVIFGICSIVAGLLSIYLPETMNRHLPESIEDAKIFGKKETKFNKYDNGHQNKTYDADDNTGERVVTRM